MFNFDKETLGFCHIIWHRPRKQHALSHICINTHCNILRKESKSLDNAGNTNSTNSVFVDLRWWIDRQIIKNLIIKVYNWRDNSLSVYGENLRENEATFTRKRYRTVIVPVWFLERKSWLFTRVRSVIVRVLGPVHTGTVSYRSEAFRAKTSKRKSDMSTN